MKSLLSLLAKLDRSNSAKQNRSFSSTFISRSVKLSLHSWLLGISIITAIPIGSIVSEIRPAEAGTLIRAFTKRKQRQANGSIRIIGNSNTTCSSTAALSTSTIANNCAAAQNRGGTAASLQNNNNNYIVNVNVSPSGTAGFNSSSADFTLPANGKIKHAYLYWGANTSAGDATSSIRAGTVAPDAAKKNQIQFKVGSASYQPITATNSSPTNATDTSGIDTSGTTYHAFYDVTSIIDNQQSGTTRTYAVADIQAGLGGDRYSGWSLVIVYDDPAEPWRELNVFDGFGVVGPGGTPTNPDTLTTSISGFNVPTSGAFSAEFGAFAYEGDMGTTGDTFGIGPVTTPPTAETTIGTGGSINGTTNFWDSSITTLPASVYSRSPNFTNTFGLDIDLFALSAGVIKNGDTSASLAFKSSGDFYYPGAFTFAVDSAAISGRVFEDVNYGGGSGRDYAVANNSAATSVFPLTVAASTSAANTTDRIGANGAVVELYDDTGKFVATTTTDAQGRYGFSQNIKIGTYSVRVVNSSVKSVRPGGSTATGLIPVETFQTDGATSVAVSNTNLVGGKDPVKVDAPENTAKQNLSAFFAQSVSTVVVADNDAVPDTNFGFNFDTIVNTNDTGQGSLRQFITNSNGLTNAKLDQDPNATPAAGTTAIDPAAGVETSIFMISDGKAHNGLTLPTTGSSNQLTNGVASIVPITALPIITDANTTIDGSTQTVNIGDTKTGSVGYSGIVGTIATNTLAGINNPEVVISNAHTLAAGLSATGDSFTVRGMSIYGFGVGNTVDDANILFAGTKQFLVEQSLIGIPSGGSPGTAPISGTFSSKYAGIAVKGAVSNVTIQDNVIAQNGSSGLLLNTGAYTNLTIQRNESAYNGVIDPANGDGITLTNCTTNCSIQTNYLHDNQAYGLQDQANTGLQVKTNTISSNGSGGIETAGMIVWGSTGTQVTNNNISKNTGDGLFIARNPINSGQALGKTIKISQNSFFSNGKLGIDLAEATANASIDYSSGQAVTPNNGLVGSIVANNGMDYPVITFSKLTSGSLQVKGFVGNVATGSSTFNAPTLEFFIAANDGNQDGAVVLNDGQTKPHGEGKTYIGTCPALSTGLFNCTFSTAGATGLTDAKNITATATDSIGNTSEFSSIPNAAKVILVKRITKIDGQTINPNDSTKDLSVVIDSAATPNDDLLGKKWPGGYLQGLVDAGKVKPNNTIEYTIYYLNEGNADVSALKICDPIRGSQKYVPGTMKLSTGGSTVSLSDAVITGDLANTYGAAALPTVVTAPIDCNISATSLTTNLAKDVAGNIITDANGNVLSTDNGGVAIQLVGTNGTIILPAIPGATSAGAPNTSYGSFKFTTRVNP
jgi:Right handed beta helix region/SdrD B-like domain